MYTSIKQKDLFELASEMLGTLSTGIESKIYAYPKINTFENDNHFRLDIYYPGIKKQDFKIKVEDKKLNISSDFSAKKEEKEEKENETIRFKEFYNRDFSRTFVLPNNVVKSEIKASYEDGVLKIVIPKDKAKEKEMNFNINVE